MDSKKVIYVTLLILFITFQITSLTVPHHRQSQSNIKCSKNQCMSQYHLSQNAEPFNPFKPNCKQDDAKCWRAYHALPECDDDNLTCWQQAVGYPKNCSDTDYKCWLDYYGIAQCQDVKCVKNFTNFTCAYDDLECWKTKAWSQCKWNDWSCIVKSRFLEYLCMKGQSDYKCVQQVFLAEQCKETDQKCWRQKLYLPDADCQQNVECFKKFYFFPDCKDDDFGCWKNLLYTPDCKKDDIQCLKDFFWLPKCSGNDQIKCYKQWLHYPDCKKDDAKCFAQYYQNNNIPIIMYDQVNIQFADYHKGKVYSGLNHNKKSDKVNHLMSFGEYMEHKRKTLGNYHNRNMNGKHMKMLKKLHKIGNK